MSMLDIDTLDKKFDLVVSSLAIHYIEDYDGLCKKVFNILNEGGEFIFSYGHPMDSCAILDDYSKNLATSGRDVAKTMSDMIEAATMFRKSGFSDEEASQLAVVAY